MKAYLFDSETGVYQGETFEEADMLAEEEGITRLPPPPYGPGQVAVFDRQHQLWELVPTGIARQLMHLPGREKRP